SSGNWIPGQKILTVAWSHTKSRRCGWRGASFKITGDDESITLLPLGDVIRYHANRDIAAGRRIDQHLFYIIYRIKRTTGRGLTAAEHVAFKDSAGCGYFQIQIVDERTGSSNRRLRICPDQGNL